MLASRNLGISTHSTWNIRDNEAKPAQWANALATKRRRGWSDDHPTWRREYLGEWVADNSELCLLVCQGASRGQASYMEA